MKVKEYIVNRIKAAQNATYKASFKPGDIILNKRDKIVRKVRQVVPDTLGNDCMYILTDVANPLKNPRYKNREVQKQCKALDTYYEKIPEESARILYGSTETRIKLKQ